MTFVRCEFRSILGQKYGMGIGQFLDFVIVGCFGQMGLSFWSLWLPIEV
jgi:hypothetical protein